MPTCKQWREGDENACTCGYRWGVKDDEDPHPRAPDNDRIRESSYTSPGGKRLTFGYEKTDACGTSVQDLGRPRKRVMTALDPEYVRYCFECECNGEIPIDQAPSRA